MAFNEDVIHPMVQTTTFLHLSEFLTITNLLTFNTSFVMKKFLLIATNAGNGCLEYHIVVVNNPKPHQLHKAISVHDTYEQAAEAKTKAKATPNRSFSKPHYLYN